VLRAGAAGVLGCESQRFNVKAAERAQKMLARKVEIRPLSIEPCRVAGLDVSYLRVGSGEVGVGVAVLISLEKGLAVEACSIYLSRICVPYIPGFLAFRELAVLAPAFTPLARLADIVIVDGHGIAHPRRFGIASHVGVIYGLPSIGVAKKKLAGEEVEASGKTYIVMDGDIVGVVVRKGRSKVYVSPGHLVDVASAEKVVLRTMRGRLPEPTLRADELSKILKTLIGGSKPLYMPEFAYKCVVNAKRGMVPSSLLKRLKDAGLRVNVG
jgi:deoxyribonuclease V